MQQSAEYGPLSAELVHCVLWTALTQDPVDVVETTVHSFAAGLRRRGYPADAYRNLGQTLVRSVRATLSMGWTSQLSSGWVSYALWLQSHLQAGASSVTAASRGGDIQSLSLRAILAALRRRYFAAPNEERGLNAVCTRVMLRTGADLRNPRPEQNTDPIVINEVLESLLVMGYAPAAMIGIAGRPAVPVGVSDPEPITDESVAESGRWRWWRRWRRVP